MDQLISWSTKRRSLGGGPQRKAPRGAWVLCDRSQHEWALMQRNATTFLKNVARVRRLTNCRELRDRLAWTTEVAPFRLGEPLEVAAEGHLLHRVDAALYPTTGVLLSAVVATDDKSSPRPAFGREAIDYGLLDPNATTGESVRFWYDHLDLVFAGVRGRAVIPVILTVVPLTRLKWRYLVSWCSSRRLTEGPRPQK